jgi:arylsulfatase A-like enzyme
MNPGFKKKKLRISILPGFFLTCLVATSMAQQANVLWITIEDTSPHFVGCYGNSSARTPAIDRIANEGTRFSNAFSNGTVCSPSRSAIITGCRTNALGTGNHRSQYPIPKFIKGFPSYLREAGYYTSNNSKTDYNSSDAERIIHESWDESSATAGWWKRKPGQAFFSVFNFIDSHESRVMTNPWDIYVSQVLDHLDREETIDPEHIAMPPFLKDSPEMRREHSRIYNGLSLTDKKIDTLLRRLRADGLMDSTIIFFFADHGEGMPRGKSNSSGLGYRVPWAIWFPGMYRDISPWPPGKVSEELVNFVDLAPTMLSLSGIAVPDYMAGRPLIGNQRSEAEEYIFLSNDRTGEATDLERSITDGRYIYTRVYMPFMPEHRWTKYHDYAVICRTMVSDFREGKLNDIQQLTFQRRTAERLYDLQDDPWEVHNLAGDPEYNQLLIKFRNALNEKLIAIRDIHFLPEYDLDRIGQISTPYEFRLDNNQYPFMDIFKSACLSGFGDSVMEKQIKLLNHHYPVVRYWAAIGLRSQTSSLERYREQLITGIYDSYVPCGITLAGICHNEFDHPAARNYLMKACEHENPHLALMALQTILYLDKDKSGYYLPLIREINHNPVKKRGFEKVRDASEMLLYVLEKKELYYEFFW